MRRKHHGQDRSFVSSKWRETATSTTGDTDSRRGGVDGSRRTCVGSRHVEPRCEIRELGKVN